MYHAEPGADLGQLVAEEVARSTQATLGCRLGLCRITLQGGGGYVQPDPGQHGVAKGLHIGHGIGQRQRRVGAGPGTKRGRVDLLQGTLERTGVLAQLGVLCGAPGGGTHALCQ